MANYLQILTSLYGNPGVDTLPTATGKKGWVRYDTTGGILISDGAAWVLLSSGGGGSSNLDGLTDVDLTSNTPDNSDVLTYNGTAWVPAPPPGATGGEANTLTNVGTGSQIAKGKAGVNYDVRTFLAAAGGKITVTQNTNDITLQVVDASETQKGAVELSLADGSESAGGRAVQDNDTRLTNARTPLSHTYASHTGIPATFAPSAHNHAGTEITSGVIPAAQLPAASETAKGAVELATSAEVTAGLAVQASDTRLSDSRAPTTHQHSAADITSGTIPAGQLPSATNSVKGAVITSLSNGTESAGTKVILDNDTRLTNSRTPVAHNHSGTEITSGTVPVAQLPTATESAKGIAELATSAETTAGLIVQANDTRLSDARTPVAHNQAGETITSGTIPVARIQDATDVQKGVVELSLANGSESGGGRAVQDSDTRLTNARTPTTHSHGNADITALAFSKLTDVNLKSAYQLVNTTPVTLSATLNQLVKVDASGGARTINLPAAGSNQGLYYTIIKSDSSSFAVTIDGAASETINGALTMVLTTQYQSVVLRCDGAAWFSTPFSTERRGKSTASGNGSATTFNIPHGLGVVPHDVLIQCSSHGGDFTRTEDPTNIIVTFTSAAPGAGTNNVIFHWSAVP